MKKDFRGKYGPVAEEVAANLLGATPVRFAPRRMSTRAHWFESLTGDALVVVVPPGTSRKDVDSVLAYGLAWQQDRDLLLVLPSDMIYEVLTRAAWLGTEVRVWKYDGYGEPVPVPVPSRAELLSHLGRLPERKGEEAALRPGHQHWLAGVETGGLIAHNRSYLSWHHNGIQVLKVQSSKKGLRVQAGVQYRGSVPGREPFDKTFATPPTPGELAVINAKVQLAIEDDGSKTSEMRGHKMQANLVSHPEKLGLKQLWREFPAYRTLRTTTLPTGGHPGYIDFLGADQSGALHVVETKIGDDPAVVLQALDYAIWVKANEARIRERLKDQGHDVPVPVTSAGGDTAPVPIHLVLGQEGRKLPFNGYLAGQIEALAGDCKVHIHLTADPTADDLVLESVAFADVWQSSALISAPVTPPRWPERLTRKLIEDAS